MRITQKDLDQKVEQLNRIFETESFSVGGAYGGWMLHRTLPKDSRYAELSGGRLDMSPRCTKKELWRFMDAMLIGRWVEKELRWLNKIKEVK